MHLPKVPRLLFVSPTLQLKYFFDRNIYSWTEAFDRNLPRISAHQGSPFELSEAITFSLPASHENIPLEYPKETFAVSWLNFHTICNYLIVMKSGESRTHIHKLGCWGLAERRQMYWWSRIIFKGPQFLPTHPNQWQTTPGWNMDLPENNVCNGQKFPFSQFPASWETLRPQRNWGQLGAPSLML